MLDALWKVSCPSLRAPCLLSCQMTRMKSSPYSVFILACPKGVRISTAKLRQAQYQVNPCTHSENLAVVLWRLDGVVAPGRKWQPLRLRPSTTMVGLASGSARARTAWSGASAAAAPPTWCSAPRSSCAPWAPRATASAAASTPSSGSCSGWRPRPCRWSASCAAASRLRPRWRLASRRRHSRPSSSVYTYIDIYSRRSGDTWCRCVPSVL